MTISTKKSANSVEAMMNFISYADGNNDLIDIANIIGVQAEDLYDIVDNMERANLIEWE